MAFLPPNHSYIWPSDGCEKKCKNLGVRSHVSTGPSDLALGARPAPSSSQWVSRKSDTNLPDFPSITTFPPQLLQLNYF